MKKSVAPVGTPVRYNEGWHVPSRSGHGVYFVKLQPRISCTCGAWRFGHGAPCAHIRAIKTLVGSEVNMG